VYLLIIYQFLIYIISNIQKNMLNCECIIKMHKRIEISSQIFLFAKDINNEQSDFLSWL